MSTPLRKWKIEYKIDPRLDLGTLKDLVESLRGYGSVEMVTVDTLPVEVHALFETGGETHFNEFDLAEALADTIVTLGLAHRDFPARPFEVEEAS